MSLQREALLANAVMAFTQLIKKREKILHITRVKFGCGSAALAMNEKIPVKFLPSEITVRVPFDSTILHAAEVAGLWIDAPCNGKQICGKCRVRIVAGNVHNVSPVHLISSEDILNGWCLACATKVVEPVTIEIPQSSGGHVVSEILVDGAEVKLRHDPQQQGHLGIAFDLGTTSVAATLFDLFSGLERESAATHNQQIKYGDDVISRIAFARDNPDGLQQLQSSAVNTLNQLMQSLCQSCGEKISSILHMTVAGNTTMQQILLGIDPSPLGEYPFKPAFKEPQYVLAQTTGLLAGEDADLIVFPQIGGFVGGDTVAGLLAANFDNIEKPSLFVDIGTNGEIALLHKGCVLAASTAAGPAFEGARIYHGMRAREGAIDKIWCSEGSLHLHVIGDVEATGLCGSALIDCVAMLLEEELLETSGQLCSAEAGALKLKGRIFEDEKGQPAFALTYETDGSPKIFLTQRDVRELQLASGTIRAGIETLLHKAGLTVLDLDGIYLAGGFGNYIRREKALVVGMLPPVHYMSIHFIGNASLTGAKRVLLSRAEMTRAESMLEHTEHVDLSAQPEFSNLFMEYMMFPE